MILIPLGIRGNSLNQVGPSPLVVVLNANARPSLVNSIDFHPDSRLFCATFTQNNCLVIYQLDNSGKPILFQVLQDPHAKLDRPQHALFSKDGGSLIVANWCNQTFNVYRADPHGGYERSPVAVVPFPSPTNTFRPHGMTISPDGKRLAVAFGAAKQHPKAVALFQILHPGTDQVQFQLLDLLQSSEIEMGIPRGITFSPDGTCLLVTLSETNALLLYALDVSYEKILSTPRQILQGEESGLSRPGDIKFTADGNCFAISNSDKDTITFYTYDPEYNYIWNQSPFHTMKNPEAELCFPHGLAFSPDGKYLAVTQFGPAIFDKDSNLSSWGSEMKDSVRIYRIE